ncbi:hypothetical protein ACQ4PT_058338 [Festuca glaucescens]
MNGSGFDMRLGIESALRRALPYGGLPSNDSPQTAFFDAATEGDLRRLRELASGKDAKEKAWLADVSIQGLGPFQAAARLGRVDVCRCMVEELGFDINAGSKIGVTALSAAALDGKMDAVRYLLDHGADPNKKDDAGSVPLHCAAKFGILSADTYLFFWHDEAASLLLSRGASVDIAYFHGTPLHIAAAYGKTSVIKVLLEHHADCGAMPIQIAASCGRRKHVELLFPLTSPIRAISNWTVEGILAHAKSKCCQPRDHEDDNNAKVQLKLCGEKAVKRKDYRAASMFYSKAIELDPSDATLYSNRSFCTCK